MVEGCTMDLVMVELEGYTMDLLEGCTTAMDEHGIDTRVGVCTHVHSYVNTCVRTCSQVHVCVVASSGLFGSCFLKEH